MSQDGSVLFLYHLSPIKLGNKTLEEIYLERIKNQAKKTYQKSKGTPAEEFANIVNQNVQKWQIGNPEQMAQNMIDIYFLLKTKIPDIPENKPIYDKMNEFSNEKYVSRQYKLLYYIISLIPQTQNIEIGELHMGDKIDIRNVEGNVIGVGVKGSNNIIAKEVHSFEIHSPRLQLLILNFY